MQTNTTTLNQFSSIQIEQQIHSKILLLNSAELKQELAFYIAYLLS